MKLFKGQECPVCKNIFDEKSDIVVCPDCGTPHHRECYRSNGSCANLEKHSQNFEWKGIAVNNENEQKKICPKCGFSNPETSTVCSSCNERLGEKMPFPPVADHGVFDSENVTAPHEVYAKRLADMEIDGIPLRDLMVFVRKNPMYFLRIFPYLAQKSALPPFNWAALFFNFFYLFYRKMYKYGILFLGAIFLFKLPSFLLMYKIWPQYAAMMPEFMNNVSAAYTFVPDFTGLEVLQLMSGIGSYLTALSSLVCGFMANKLYFKHCVNKVKQIRQKHLGQENAERSYHIELSREGSTSSLAVVIVAVLIMAAFYMFSFWIVTSTYI